jgi:hypothetical protein
MIHTPKNTIGGRSKWHPRGGRPNHSEERDMREGKGEQGREHTSAMRNGFWERAHFR